MGAGQRNAPSDVSPREYAEGWSCRARRPSRECYDRAVRISRRLMSEKLADQRTLGDGPEADACGGDSASPKRAAIIAAATDLFTHSGYGAVSMDAIAAKAGVSKRTVYSHFPGRSEEHTSELQSLMRISYAVFCLKKK